MNDNRALRSAVAIGVLAVTVCAQQPAKSTDLTAGPHWETRPPVFTLSGSEVRGRSIVFSATWQMQTGELHW